MTHLFIVAHPDDEILGGLGAILRIKRAGGRAAVAVMSSHSATREKEIEQRMRLIHAELGIDATYTFSAFAGVLVPDGYDENNDIVYKYNTKVTFEPIVDRDYELRKL